MTKPIHSPIQSPGATNNLKIKSWGTLGTKHFNPVKFIIEDLLPPGVTLLSGRPKQGKSWLVHGMLLKVAAGHKVFGSNVNQCDTLYMALEDSERRLQQRTKKLMKSHGITDKEIANRFHVTTEAKILGDGLENQLEKLLTKNPKIKFVVIDVLARIRQPRKPGQGVYDADYEVGIRLKNIAKSHPDVAFLVVHHNNKGDGDSLDSVSGSHGLTGGVDNVLVMMNTGNGMELHINGRDIEDSSPIALTKNNDGMWSLGSRSSSTKSSNSNTKNMVLDAIKNGHATPKDIVKTTSLKLSTVTQQLLRMVKNNELVKLQRGTYGIPPKPTCTP